MSHLAAVVSALRFHEPDARGLQRIPQSAWPALLDETDRAQLTLALGARCREFLPDAARSRIDRNLADNAERYARLTAAHNRIIDTLALRQIDFAVLKGLALWPYYSDDPRQRPQYDIDLYVPSESLEEAAHAVRELGYEAVSTTLDSGADHLPVMIRRTGWRWQGNYYDPEMPPSLELHFRFWNPEMVRFDVGDTGIFWPRRRVREVDGQRFPALHPVDGLSYAALHLLRHLLTGDLRLRHVYEIAHFLTRSIDDDAFWKEWRETALPACRVAEGIAFRLAREWFGCGVHAAAREATEQLPAPVKRWFRLFGNSPALVTGQANKNELWLHFCLAQSQRDRRQIAWRRLLPARQSRVVLDAHVPGAKAGWWLGMKRPVYEAAFLSARALHHARTLAPTLRGACRWWLSP